MARKFAGKLAMPKGPLGKIGLYSYFTMQRLGNNPLFSAPLLNSLILAIGIGVPTYTRATIATVTDWEGIVRPVVAGEARFSGARRVQNLLQNTGFLAIGAGVPTGWNHGAAGGVLSITPSLSDSTHNQANYAVNNNRDFLLYTVDMVLGRSYRLSCFCEAKAEIAPLVDISLHLVPTTATFSGNPAVSTVNLIPGRRSAGNVLLCTLGGQATFRIGLGCGSTEFGNGSISISHPQFEDVTGQTNQAPGEYTSYGVLNAPYYGTGVDGIQYLQTSNANSVAASKLVTQGNGTQIPAATLLGYLAEPQRTNLLLASEDFTDVNWIKVDTTPTADAIISPNGTINADLLTEGVTGTAVVSQAVVAVAADNYSVTRFWKFGNTQWMRTQILDGGGNSVDFWFDIQNGVVGANAVAGTALFVRSTIRALANGWFECRCVGSIGGVATAITSNSSSAAANGSVVRVNNSTRYEWGAMFNDIGTDNTCYSYIPTSGAAVQRNIDRLLYQYAGNALAAVGACYAELNTQWTIAIGAHTAVGFGGAEMCLGCFTTAASTVIHMGDGVTAVTKSGLSDMSTGVRKRMSTWGSISMIITGDGLAPTVSGAFDGDIGSIAVGIGNDGVGNRQFGGNLRNVAIYGTLDTSAQLQNQTA